MSNQYTKKILDENEIIKQYVSGVSIFKLRIIFNTSKERIEEILIGNNVYIENRDKIKKEFISSEIELIKDYYLNKNLSCEKIGKYFGISKVPIKNLLKNMGLLKQGISNGIKINLTNEEKDKIKYLYLKEYKNCEEIGKILGLTSSFINKYLSTVDYRRNKSDSVAISLAKQYGHNYDDYINNLSEYKKYKRLVYKITNQQNINTLINFDKRGLTGHIGAYHLDHKYSIVEGFKNSINPEIIGNIKNLEFIPWEDNLKKKNKCSITRTELIKNI